MPRNVFALFACLCVLGFASPNAVGQSPRLAWANDFARLESGLSFMKSSPDTIRVVLRTGLDPKSFERKDVTTSWMVAKTELPEMLKRNRCLARGLAGKNDGTEVIIVYPRDFPISRVAAQ